MTSEEFLDDDLEGDVVIEASDAASTLGRVAIAPCLQVGFQIVNATCSQTVV